MMKIIKKMIRTFAIFISLGGFTASQLLLAQEATEGSPKAGFVEINIPLRGTPDGNGRIIRDGIANGTEVNKLSIDGSWAYVELGDGMKGWLPNRFVSTEVKDDSETEQLKARVIELRNELQQLKDNSSELKRLQAQLNNLKDKSTVEKLSRQNKSLLTANQSLQAERDMLTTQLEESDTDFLITWFLYGSFAVFLGGVLTIIAVKLWPRKSNGWG